jgi:hypothetical protein
MFMGMPPWNELELEWGAAVLKASRSKVDFCRRPKRSAPEERAGPPPPGLDLTGLDERRGGKSQISNLNLENHRNSCRLKSALSFFIDEDFIKKHLRRKTYGKFLVGNGCQANPSNGIQARKSKGKST